MKTKIKDFLKEAVIVPPTIPNSMNFWHGGNLDDYTDVISHKNGRYEYGAGLYLTTHYGTAEKYSKGSRKLYLITVENGVDINKSVLDMVKVYEFVNKYVIGNKRKEILNRFQNYIQEGKIKAYIFDNVLLNENAIKASNTKYMRNFYIENGIDYNIVPNAFGWGENMLVLYNMKKILNVIQIKPKDIISQYDLH